MRSFEVKKMIVKSTQLVHIPRGERLDSLGFGRMSKYKILSWLGQKVWIVDVSEGGVKFEVSSQIWNRHKKSSLKIKPGFIRSLVLELNSYPGFKVHLSLQIEVKWFDASAKRGGGTFVNTSAADQQKIDAFLKYLSESKQSNTEKLEEIKATG
jgi:hypothetical protein